MIQERAITLTEASEDILAITTSQCYVKKRRNKMTRTPERVATEFIGFNDLASHTGLRMMRG